MREQVVWNQTGLGDPEGELREKKKDAGRKRNPGESANGAIYTGLGDRPWENDRFIRSRVAPPFCSTVLSFFVVRSFSPYEKKGH